MQHTIQDIISIFNQTFFEDFNTKLELGGDEPIYMPASGSHSYHRIVFARGYYASALHEISHWCVAGPKRRLLEDFGYWYEPDGRDQVTQERFEAVEVRPQAYEWILSESAGFKFNVSCDNLHGSFEPNRNEFKRSVHNEVREILQQGLPNRVSMLSNALRNHYNVPELNEQQFTIE